MQDYFIEVDHDFTKDPKDNHYEEVRCSEFFESTRLFFEKSFRGTVKLDYPKYMTGYIKIAPTLFAYFMKILVYEAHGNYMISVTIKHTPLTVSVIIKRSVPLEFEEKLCKIAEEAGFSVEKSDEEMVIITDVFESMIIRLRARDSVYFMHNYVDVFLGMYE